VVQVGEQCDFGTRNGVSLNDGAHGGCAADCTLVGRCGDGVLHACSGEECDDGNHLNGDGCSPVCTRERTLGAR
jgi:cysteine-rich repeat protein